MEGQSASKSASPSPAEMTGWLRSVDRREEGGTARPEDVVRAWRAGRNLVPLIDGGFAPLQRSGSRYGTLLSELTAAKEVTDEVPVSLVPS